MYAPSRPVEAAGRISVIQRQKYIPEDKYPEKTKVAGLAVSQDQRFREIRGISYSFVPGRATDSTRVLIGEGEHLKPAIRDLLKEHADRTGIEPQDRLGGCPCEVSGSCT
jgi:hypothetical protein